MQPYSHFKFIELGHQKFLKKLTLALALIGTSTIPILIVWNWDLPWGSQVTIFPSIIWSALFWGMVIIWVRNPEMIFDPNNRICSNCETKVPTYSIMQTCTFDVLGVTDSTRAITSTNAVSGVTSTGGHMGVGFGSIESTSHVPVKMGRLKFTASCPSCKAAYSWNEDREVTQWTNPSGQVSYEIVGRVDLP